MPPLHSLLKRQIRRYLGSDEAIPPEFEPFVQAVNEAYHEIDYDREMLERSLELSSQELIQANSDIGAVLQAFPDLFFWLDEDDVIVDCKSGGSADIYPAFEKLVGKRLQSIPMSAIFAKFNEAVSQVRATKQLVSIEYSLDAEEGLSSYEARLVPILGTKIIAIVRNITERKRAEVNLREAEERYRMQLQSALDAIFVADAETGILVDGNPAAARLVGRDRSELIGQHQSILHPSEDFEGDFTKTFKEHLKEKDGAVLETRVVTKKGKTRDVAIKTNLFEIGGRKVIQGIFRDITDRKRAMEALRESEERYRTFVDSTTDMAYLKDDQFRYIVVNKANQAFFGYAESKVLGKTDFDLMPLEAAEACRQSDRQALEENGIVIAIEQMGEKIFETRKFPVLLRDGRRGVGAFIRDITEHRRAEEALQESEERFRNLVERAPDVIYTLSADGTLTSLNPVFEKITGWRQEECVGQSFKSFIHPDDLPIAVGTFKAALKGERPPTYELRIRGRSGQWVVAEFTSGPLIEKGAIAGELGIARDITERKHAEDALRRSEEQLRQLQKMEAVGRLAGGIAHDFNNLLTTILGFGRLVLDRVKEPDVRADVQEILSSGERAARLTNQLLAFSRKQVSQPNPLDLNGIVADMERLLHPTLGENINLLTIPGENLGMIQADRGQMEQVIMNLALNARDAMPKGGNLTIETHKETVGPDKAAAVNMPGGDYVVLIVRDTGVGMTHEIRRHAFEPFFTSKDVGKGVGLGLSTVYGIVQQCGGWVDLLSEPGKGTEVRVYLPWMAGVQKPVKAAREMEVPRGHETILLAEDEESVRHLAMRVLSALGYKVLGARSGLEALRLYDEYKGTIDLVLTDVIMPIMSGPELVQQLESKRAGIRVLYVTGFTEGNVPGASASDPKRQLMFKPYTRETLAREVRQALDRSPHKAKGKGQGVARRRQKRSRAN